MDLRNATKDTPAFSFAGMRCDGKVVDVYDGDTCRVVIRYQGDLVKLTLRLMHIDTPELRSKDPEEREAAKAARDRLRELCLGKIVEVQLGDFDNFGRVLAVLWPKPKYSINQMLLTEGHAEPYED